MVDVQPDECPRSQKALKRRFTPAEDEVLLRLLAALGPGRWEEIARYIPERSPRQCRERYENYLTETFPKYPWTPADDEQLLKQVAARGHHWTIIAQFFPGRNTNDLKNRWYKFLAKRETGTLPDVKLGLGSMVTPFVPVTTSPEVEWLVSDGCTSDWAIDDPFLV
jgi:N-glycosylase/DNA lyase